MRISFLFLPWLGEDPAAAARKSNWSGSQGFSHVLLLFFLSALPPSYWTNVQTPDASLCRAAIHSTADETCLNFLPPADAQWFSSASWKSERRRFLFKGDNMHYCQKQQCARIQTKSSAFVPKYSIILSSIPTRDPLVTEIGGWWRMRRSSNTHSSFFFILNPSSRSSEAADLFIPVPPVPVSHFNSSNSADKMRRRCDVQFPMCFPLKPERRTMSPSFFEVTPPAVRPKASAFIQQSQRHLPAMGRPYGAWGVGI